MALARSLDDVALNKFHMKLVTFVTGGLFVDGYILGSISIALAFAAPQLHLSPLWTGLIGSSALIGLFVGSAIFGWVTDIVGRRPLYVANLLVFILGSVSQFFVQSSVTLFVVRLIMGIAIGADYAIGPAYLSEFVPRRRRGGLLGSLNTVWTLGYVVSIVVSYLLRNSGPEAWRWMLVASALPAFIVLLFRIGIPESPRWLMTKGRTEDAHQIIQKYFGNHVSFDSLLEERHTKAGYKELFSSRFRTRTAFSGLFWFCHVAPYFAIATFLPELLKSLAIKNAFSGTVGLNVLELIGSVVGLLIIDRFSRRKFVIWSFILLALPLLLLGVIPAAPVLLVMLCFAFFALVTTGTGNIEFVYPSELFPTSLRASGAGLAASVSRVGAAVGTFLLPLSMNRWGVHVTLIIAGLIMVAGLAISMAWAPDTNQKTLVEASGLIDSVR